MAKKAAKTKSEHPAVNKVKDAIYELQVFVERLESDGTLDTGYLDAAEEYLSAARNELPEE